MNVESLMSREPDCCHPADTIRAIAIAMRDDGIGMLPVIDDHGSPLGVITDRDVCLAVAAGRPTSAPAAEIMTSPAVCCHRADHPRSALSSMRFEHVRRLVVVDDHGAVCGVLALDDIAAEARERVHEHVPSHGDVVETLRAVSRYRDLQPASS